MFSTDGRNVVSWKSTFLDAAVFLDLEGTRMDSGVEVPTFKNFFPGVALMLVPYWFPRNRRFVIFCFLIRRDEDGLGVAKVNSPNV